MADDNGQYVSDDERYGQMLGNLLNPPPEAEQQVASAAPAPQPVRPPVPMVPANDPRFAVPATEPPNPVLRTRPTATPSPSPAVAPVLATPAVATPSGNTPSFYQRAQTGALNAADQRAQAATALQSVPDATTENAPLEARRAALSQPLDPNDPRYRPGIATRIARGFYGARQGGIGGILDPSLTGGPAYGAPNGRFAADTAGRQQQITSIDQQMGKNTADAAAAVTRQKDIGTAEGDVAADYSKVGEGATAQQRADTAQQTADLAEQTRKDNSPVGVAALDQATFDQRRKQADQIFGPGKGGSNRDIYLANGKLPDPRQATEGEIARAQATTAWRRANPGKTMTLEDIAAVNAAATGYGGPRGNGNNNLTPNQMKAVTTAKNTAIQKAQAQFDQDSDSEAARTAMQAAQDNYEQIIGVDPSSPDHWTVGADLKWNRAGGGQAAAPGPPQSQPAAQPAAPAQTAPSALTTPVGKIYKGYKRLPGDPTQQSSWQKVAPGAQPNAPKEAP